MTLVIFGRTGQVAVELAAQAAKLAIDAVFVDRHRANLEDPAACAAVIRAHRPRAVINAAAWTAVDKAESEETRATIINADAPTAMAVVCAELEVPFVHISTDYVFDGSGTTAFTPDHPPMPLSAYGRSKLKGEHGVRGVGGAHAILRTSWVFSAHGNNFLKTMLRLGRERETLNVVADQIGGPTPARAIAQACLAMADQLIDQPQKGGTYHFSGAPDVSWAEFARVIMSHAGLPCRINDIPTAAYPTPATRPANSRLDCTSLAIFNLARPDWKIAVRDTVLDLKGPRAGQNP